MLALACSCTSGGAGPAARATASAVPSPAAPTPAAAPSPTRVDALQRLSPRVGFVSGGTPERSLVAETTDGGATWRRLAAPGLVTALRFIDERVGWAAAANAGAGQVLRTTDGGATWRQTLSFAGDPSGGWPVRQLEAADADHAWAVVTASPPCSLSCPLELRRTADGGRTWTTPQRGGVAAIRFASAGRGWLAGADGAGGTVVRVTDDGGGTWRDEFRTPSRRAVTGLDAATPGTAWLMTEDPATCTTSGCGTYELFHTEGGAGRWSSLGSPTDRAVGCGVHNPVGPVFASTARGWLALAGGAAGDPERARGLLATDDGGRTWRCPHVPSAGHVSAADPLHVWATTDVLGQDAALYATDDGGATWRRIELAALRSP
jgi:photosystem II stability/assembly factor-like uncharacterized protein